MPTETERLIDWYWTLGRQRNGPYELSQGGWLDQLYTADRVETAIAFSRRYPKVSFALWGPSQSGKSSLLEGYLDREDDPDGKRSALSWPGGEPARFRKRPDTPAETVGFNPYNNGLDGSGCVSRFQLATEIADPRHPVEIRLVEPVQLMHALAMGYLSECRTVVPETKLKVKLNAEQFRELLEKHEQLLEKQQRPVAGAASADPRAYQQLHQLADVLDLLILSGQDRYENLKPEQRSLREHLLSSPLASNVKAVEQFAADLLWDSRAKLTDLFNRLRAKNQELASTYGSRRFFCSLRAAALLLDIAAYEKLVTPGAAARVNSEVERLTVQIGADRVNIGAAGAERLIRSPDDFGLFQGLVLELIIPVRRAALVGEVNPFRDFLDVADLIDFPGVAIEEKQTDRSEIELDKLPPDKAHVLLTQVLKRGKTASIVAGYSKDLTVQGFSLLNRIDRFVSKADQLLTGIYTWWKCHNPHYSPDGRLASPMPLNLVLTFSAGLLNDVALNGIPDSLEHFFRKFRQLGPLSDPDVISHTLATNYPQLPHGHLNSKVEDLKRALDLIAKDPGFVRQFRTKECQLSLREAAYDGGTDYLFKLLRDQAKTVPCEKLWAQRERDQRSVLRGLLVEALPRGSNEAERRKHFFRQWGEKLNLSMAADTRSLDPAARVSRLLRTLLDVDFKDLDPLPRNAALQASRPVVLEYIDRQLVKWIDSRKKEQTLADGLVDLGLNGSSDLVRLLGYLADSVDKRSIGVWLIANFGGLPGDRPTREHARRFLAVKIANSLRPSGNSGDGHPAASVIEETLTRRHANGFFGDDAWDDRGDADGAYKKSYHYRHVVGPWLDEIDKLAERVVSGTRRPQPGDEELVWLVTENPRLQSLSETKNA
jgi:hypothetical protein